MEQYVVGRNDIPLARNGKLMGRYRYTLPPFTIRIEFTKDDYVPHNVNDIPDSCWTKVTGVSTNQWDLAYPYSDWSRLLEDFEPGNTSSPDANEFFRVIDAGDLSGVTKMASLFRGSTLTETCWFDISGIESMTSMFSCRYIETIPPFQTGHIKNMNHIFAEANHLKYIPWLSTKNVTDMGHMFFNCFELESVPLLDTKNVVDFSYMLTDTYVLQEVPFFDTSSGTNMKAMFFASGIRHLPKFNTSKVTNMSYMLNDCPLEEIPLLDTSKVTDMSWFAWQCESLKHVPQLDVSSLEDISYAFENCWYVESGAYDFYLRASQKIPAENTEKYKNAFHFCGVQTETGREELLRIPGSWRGSNS